MSNSLRITGLASGIDTDTTVKQMMRPYQMKLDKMKQERQITEWKQEIYRDLIGTINTFKSSYFDVLKKDTYILSPNNWSTFEAKTTDTTNSIVLTPGATALSGDYTIDVASIAKKACQTGTTNINVKQVGGSLTFPVVIDSTNDTLTIDRTQIVLENKTYSSMHELAAQINSKMASTEGGTKLSNTVKAVVSDDGNNIVMKRLLYITSENNSLTVTSSDNKEFNIKLGEGKYTMDELAEAINSKLAVTRAADGSMIPEGFMAKASEDGLSIKYTNGGTDNRSYAIDNKPMVDSTGIGAASNSVSNPTVNRDTLSYDRRIIQNINDILTFNINGTRTTITLNTGDYTNDANAYASLVSQINNNLANIDVPGAVDGSKMYSDEDNYKLKAYIDEDGKLTFESTTDYQISMTGNAAATLGMPSTFAINQTQNDKMSALIDGEVKFTINGQTFHYDFDTDSADSSNADDIVVGAKNMTIKKIIDEIAVKANVDITYSELTRKFTVSTKDTGYDQVINAVDDEIAPGDKGGEFLNTLFGISNRIDIRGEDAKVTITNPRNEVNTLHYSNNTFVLDDVNYVLNKEGTGPITFSVTPNADKAVEKIRNFIEKYNSMIDEISEKITESRPKISKYDGYYLPLTDEQKEEMSDDDIEKWKKLAKQGLIKNDSNLSNMLHNMRRAFYDTVEDAGLSFSELGLSTSSDVAEAGKIIIKDEQKLRDALINNPDKVMDLFTKTSDIKYSPDHTNYNNRYDDIGIFHRINDIMQDNVRTIRDSSGRKGVLLEKAGIKGDYSEFNNYLYKQFAEQDEKIDAFIDKFADIEERYYQQFVQLETAMNTLNSQSNWLMQQLGMGSQ